MERSVSDTPPPEPAETADESEWPITSLSPWVAAPAVACARRPPRPGEPVRLPPRRALLHRVDGAPGLGVRRQPAAHPGHRLALPSGVRRLALRPAGASGGPDLRAGGGRRADRPRARRPSPSPGAGRRHRGDLVVLPGDRPPADHADLRRARHRVSSCSACAGSSGRADQRWWIGIGVAVGVGLENKYTLLLVLASLAVATLLTGAWRRLISWWSVAGAVIATGDLAAATALAVRPRLAAARLRPGARRAGGR